MSYIILLPEEIVFQVSSEYGQAFCMPDFPIPLGLTCTQDEQGILASLGSSR